MSENSQRGVQSPWWAMLAYALRACRQPCHRALRHKRELPHHDRNEPVDRRFRDFFEFYSGAEALVKGTDVFAAWLGGWTVASRLGVPKAAPLGTFIGLALLADKLIGDIEDAAVQHPHADMLVIGMWGLDRYWLITGLALGFGFSIKSLPIVALPYFAVRGRTKHVVGLVCGVVFWAIIPAAFIGWQMNADLWRGAAAGLIHAGDGDWKTDAGQARVMNTREYGISITTAVVRTADSLGQPKFALPAAAMMWARPFLPRGGSIAATSRPCGSAGSEQRRKFAGRFCSSSGPA